MTDIRRHTPPEEPAKKKFGWWTGSLRWTKYWYLRIMRQNSTPKGLATALAMGMFIGALPIIPFQSIIVIALAFVFKLNKLAAWMATNYSNVITMGPFYYFLFLIGKTVVPFEGVTLDINHLEMVQLIESGWDLYIVMFTGGLVFGIPATIITYFGSLYGIRFYRKRRALRLLRKRTGS
ncbi:DUF2062 domain-containing protein [Pseudodesulfovibrio sp.]|nr:DUF2062 domain-containing protein [Pseudodesulfovibrio sp.]